MRSTENDLSFNHTQLDYQALLRTAVIAFAHTRNQVERLVNRTHDINPHTNHAHTARLLLDEAEQMAVAADTMHTLECGLDREELEVVNKPIVKEG